MKTKIYKILGIAVSVALVVSLCVFAIPGATPAEAGAPGKQKWSSQTLPTATSAVMYDGSDVTDIAVASDGLTIYACNNAIAADSTTSGVVLVSTDGGQGWTKLTVSTATGGRMTAIAVAPDDAQIMAVVEQTALGTDDVVHLTTNSGKTWTAMPTAYDSGVTSANTTMMDVDVGPARSGCVFGREYVVAFADTRASNVTEADVQIIGKIATWATCGSSNIPGVGDVAGKYDYMAVKFSPNFVGDRTIAAVGVDATSGGDVYLQLINDDGKEGIRLQGVGAASVNDLGASANATITADIAFPSDFDPTVTSLQRTYIAFASVTTTDNDVYRITGSTVRDLDAVTAKAIKSITYSGTVDEGTLWLGEYLDENVKYTLDATVSLPTWKSTKKAPSADPAVDNLPGDEALTIVRVSPADPNVVFAATSGAESAFSVSNNAGVSFDGESLIDNGVADTVLTVDDIYLSPDGETIFMATRDGTSGTYQINLWKSSLPTGSTSWSRVYVKTGTTGMIRLNPDYGDTPTVYLIDVALGGDIYVSTNGGDTWSTRSAPATITALDIAVESSMTLYLAEGTTVRKSTNGAWTWGTPISTKVGDPILTLAMAASYPNTPEEGVLLVGGTSACSYSLDGGTTFTKISSGLTSDSRYQILAHPDYADNSTIYCADTTGDTYDVLRFVIGTSTAWEDLIANATIEDTTDVELNTKQVSGLGIANGVLYALTNEDDGAHRSLSSTGAAGTLTWEAMDAGIGTGAELNQAPSALRVSASTNTLYAIDTSPTGTTADKVYAYSDPLATDVPKLAFPADGAAINVDSVTGYAEDIQLKWDAMGSGTGLADSYGVWIAVAGTDFRAPLRTTFSPTYATDPRILVGDGQTFSTKLMANTDYEWRVRALDEVSNDAVRSGFSTARSFSVQAGGRVEQAHAGPIMLGPTGGAVDVTLTPGFSWAPVPRATEYEFILASDAGLTKTLAGTPVKLTSPAFQCTEKLAYGTVYFWAVKATKPTVSVQAIGSFTTMAEPVEPAAPVEILPTPAAPEVPPTPSYIWAIIGIGAVLAIVVIVLIVRTRRAV